MERWWRGGGEVMERWWRGGPTQIDAAEMKREVATEWKTRGRGAVAGGHGGGGKGGGCEMARVAEWHAVSGCLEVRELCGVWPLPMSVSDIV